MCLWSLSLTRYLMNWKSLQSFWSPLKPDNHSAFLNCLCWHVCGRFSSRNFSIQHRKTWTHTQTWGRGTYFVHFLKGALREEVWGFSLTQLLGMARVASAFIKWSHGARGFGIPQAVLSLWYILKFCYPGCPFRVAGLFMCTDTFCVQSL